MNYLVLGEGPEELAWAQVLAHHPEHRLWAACPALKAFPNVPGLHDLDEALATAGVEAVIVGGPPDFRAEALRRAAAEGLAILCLHPPGPDADSYYQVALSRQETGAVIVPDLPARLHPGVARLRAALEREELGPFRGLKLEAPVGPTDGDLVDHVFPRMVDVLRALLGEVESLTATGDPHGEGGTENLLVILHGPQARRAEIRLWNGSPEPAQLSGMGQRGSLTLEFDPGFLGPCRLLKRVPPGGEETEELPEWDPRAAMLDVLVRAKGGADVHPDLVDGTRTMELAEATKRSLRRGRTIELHFERPSEAGRFKSFMTSTGCALLLGILLALPMALVGPAFGLPWTLYLAYAIPPLLVVFLLVQIVRYALEKE
jgi:myo-inositol 2-dehydrogenase/D-chiro-inositol 1-dehydrogenase